MNRNPSERRRPSRAAARGSRWCSAALVAVALLAPLPRFLGRAALAAAAPAQRLRLAPWQEIAETLPERPFPVTPSVLGALGVLLAGLSLRRWVGKSASGSAGRRLRAATTGFIGVAIAATLLVPSLIHLLRAAPGPSFAGSPDRLLSVLARREYLFVSVVLGVACAGIAALALRGALRWGRGGFRLAAARPILIDASVVLAASVALRLAFGALNIFTDSHSGYARLLTYSPRGFGGLAVLHAWLLPASLEGYMWPAVAVNAALSTLAPAILVLLGRALGLGRAAALFAGLGLATWPLHAIFDMSDLLQGPILALSLLAFTLAGAAATLGRPALLVPGCLVLAFVVWCRPDAGLAAVPFGLLALPAMRRWWWRPELITAGAWLVLSVSMRALTLFWSPVPFAHLQPQPPSLSPLVGLLGAGNVGLPFWMVACALPGVFAASGRARWLVPLGVVLGLLPVVIKGSGPDDLELFRYSSPAMPWFALLAGAGLAGLVRWSGRLRRATGESRPTVLRRVLLIVAGLIVVVTPLPHLGYLGVRYGPTETDLAFREALRHVPLGCSVVVPGQPVVGGLDPVALYETIAGEELDAGRARVAIDQLRGADRFLRDLGARGERLPPVPASSGACWLFFRGGDCVLSPGGAPSPPEGAGSCAAVEARTTLAPVWTRRALYRYHRVVTRPGLTTPPQHQADYPYGLFRVTIGPPRAPGAP